ncbi:hypothetical protein PMZ80_002279 [Knufia obscura]|uniref:Uncharacterized protein n=2 Tax=Knufia TaxID=430999 RepID=A0AAN8ERG8_9EURO|nr:hypothetical protein PMZ80_002279 [Knufia obscura]KAK5950638.1 hypothetical protein OHC33_008304 [Knufia fluminis]
MAFSTLVTRDFGDDYEGHNGLLFGFFVLFLFACLTSLSLLYFRRKRAAHHGAVLPTHHRRGHQRSLTITTAPAYAGQDRVFVYDEKMNLIANSYGPPDSPVPEIRVTFPDEEDQSGQKMSGRVVVVRITDSGSVGMEPLPQEQLPAYQQADSGRFQSLDLNRIGGLREGNAPTTAPRPRWS